MSSPANAVGNIDDRLRELYEKSGLTISAMSEMLGIPKPSLQNYMRKKNPQKPGVEAIVAICKSFDVSADWLLGITQSRTGSGADLEVLETVSKVVFEHMISGLNVSQKYMSQHLEGGAFRDGKLFGAEPAALAADYAHQVLKLYADVQSGKYDHRTLKVSNDPSADGVPLGPPDVMKLLK
jgi:transcriptional regulator with XRE-family HTH domain